MHPIERYRISKGLTQMDMAQKLGVSTKAVGNWEAGALPRPRRLAQLAELLGVDALKLLTAMEDWKAQHPRSQPAR